MASFNKVIIVGNLTRDPDSKELQSGTKLCKFGIAVNRNFRNRNSGEMVQETVFTDVEVWGTQAESCSQYLRKGSQVLVEGRLKQDSWVDETGKRRSKIYVVAERVTYLQGSQKTDDSAATSRMEDELQKKAARIARKPEAAGEIDVPEEANLEDDLPF